MNLGAPELLIVLVVILLAPVLGIGIAIDASTKPAPAFERAGHSKTLWIVLPLVGIFLCGILTVPILAGIWFAAIRPKVVAAEQQQQ